MADNLLKRVISSITILLVVWATVFFLPNWMFCLLVVLFTGFALYEFFSIVEIKNIFVYKYFGTVAGIIIPVSIYLNLGEGQPNLEPFFIVIACLFTFVLQFIRKGDAKDHLISIAVTLLALFYVSWFFSFFIKIKYLRDGAMLITFLVLVTKMTDIGAYFTGKKFGKNLLIPRISPKKTKEGAFGGLICGTVTALILGRWLLGFQYYHSLFLGLLLSIIGQVGDLAESLFKRDFDVKDSSHNLPGLGGVLDVIDSLLFTAPIFYFYIKILLFSS